MSAIAYLVRGNDQEAARLHLELAPFSICMRTSYGAYSRKTAESFFAKNTSSTALYVRWLPVTGVLLALYTLTGSFSDHGLTAVSVLSAVCVFASLVLQKPGLSSTRAKRLIIYDMGENTEIDLPSGFAIRWI